MAAAFFAAVFFIFGKLTFALTAADNSQKVGIARTAPKGIGTQQGILTVTMICRVRNAFYSLNAHSNSHCHL